MTGRSLIRTPPFNLLYPALVPAPLPQPAVVVLQTAAVALDPPEGQTLKDFSCSS